MAEINKLSIQHKEFVKEWHTKPKESRNKELIKIISQINIKTMEKIK